MINKRILFIGGSKDGDIENVPVREGERFLEIDPPQTMRDFIDMHCIEPVELTFKVERYEIFGLETNGPTFTVATLKGMRLSDIFRALIDAYPKRCEGDCHEHH